MVSDKIERYIRACFKVKDERERLGYVTDLTKAWWDYTLFELCHDEKEIWNYEMNENESETIT